jgi:four helix bundle protein
LAIFDLVWELHIIFVLLLSSFHMPEISFKSLRVYQLAFKLAMDIYYISKKFPSEEKFALTNQLRRSSRSVCSNLAEGYRKRQYSAHFIAKTSDADMENSETQVWLDFALECQYISTENYEEFIDRSSEIGCLLNHMLKNPDKYR